MRGDKVVVSFIGRIFLLELYLISCLISRISKEHEKGSLLDLNNNLAKDEGRKHLLSLFPTYE